MAIQTVNTGTTPNDGTGDPARTSFTKINDNFTQPENAASHLLLGTVSQSGGVPTGAIIERGSNANGEYTKFADGTMICTHKMVGNGPAITAGSIFTADPVPWTYPSVFVGSNDVTGSINTTNQWVNVCQFSPNTSAAAFAYSPVYLAGESVVINMIAIGRWY